MGAHAACTLGGLSKGSAVACLSFPLAARSLFARSCASSAVSMWSVIACPTKTN